MRRHTLSQPFATPHNTRAFSLVPGWDLAGVEWGDPIQKLQDLIDVIAINSTGRLICYRWSGIGSQNWASQ